MQKVRRDYCLYLIKVPHIIAAFKDGTNDAQDGACSPPEMTITSRYEPVRRWHRERSKVLSSYVLACEPFFFFLMRTKTSFRKKAEYSVRLLFVHGGAVSQADSDSRLFNVTRPWRRRHVMSQQFMAMRKHSKVINRIVTLWHQYKRSVLRNQTIERWRILVWIVWWTARFRIKNQRSKLIVPSSSLMLQTEPTTIKLKQIEKEEKPDSWQLHSQVVVLIPFRMQGPFASFSAMTLASWLNEHFGERIW